VVREAAQGRLAPSEPVMENEEAFLKEYNERLIQKLEKKMEDLERETTVRRQSEQILKGTLAAIPDMIFRLDREGRFLDFKPAKTFDPYLTPEQFLGKTAVEVHSQELARKTMESIARALDENTTVALEYQLPYGEELRSYEARHAPCGEDLVVVVVRDITEQKQMEEELLRAQKLESVGVLAGGMGGKDAVKKLLEIDPEVKAIVSSGYSDDLVLSNFQEYGFKGVIPKPFESLSLGKVLYEVLQGEKE
jgi:PAS domain S-box-containing protein